jgi:ABC-2 type transport system permease protein
VVTELTPGSSLVNTHRPITDSAAIHYCEGFYRDARAACIACARIKFPIMTTSYPVSSQLKVIAELRWRMFVNGLRSRRGKTELVSRLVVTSVFALGGAGGFLVASFFSYVLVSQGKPEFLAVILWPIFLFWQLFPMMATAFTNNPDSTELLRFPLTYRSYFLVRLAFGFFDPACAIGTLGLLGVLLGISIARPLLFPWALVVLLTFAAFNLLLMQMVFAWLERWLAQRRTREIFGVIFILTMLSFQLIGPMVQHLNRGPHPEFRHSLEIGAKIQAVLPPGLAADAIAQVLHSEVLVGFTSLLFLAALSFAVAYLLHLRIHAQFAGESLSETAARPVAPQLQTPQLGWNFPGLSPAVAAVFEKEMRYLARSGPMLLSLIMPVFMLLVFRMGPLNPSHSGALNRTPDMAFPGAAAYALLVLTNLVYNSFGGDSGGIQFFYASPVNFRQIVLGKNVTHGAIILLNTIFAWIAVRYLYGPPHLSVAVATLTGLLFAAPLNFTAGNLLSLYSPKKRDFSAFGRQNVTQTTVLASFGMQILIVGCGIGVFAIARLYQNLWIATLLFLILAAISIPIYVSVLGRLDKIALQRRETLISELSRA